MPPVSEKQRRAMWAAAEGKSTLGIPQSVGKEYVGADAAETHDIADCAGILFKASGPLFLLVKRGDTGEWCQPGGHLEAGESFEDAAVRECVEEIGSCPEGDRWMARIGPKADGNGEYACFVQTCEPFEPKLNDEHPAFMWAHPDALPPGMHPEVEQTIRALSGNELDIAKRMVAGELASPQRYENVWLFDVRITGTGTSYRTVHDEYVYRPPENFLTDEFVARCNGLPVIFMHPEKSILNTDEYRERSIGTVMLPYLKPDEVWGIAKVFDDDAAELMLTSHASTSPAVVFRDAGSTETLTLDDGSTVLIEGKPSYLDHLAICEEGVWDKGGKPTGVNITGETNVENEEKVPAWADALNQRLDAMCSRMDAIENKGGDKSNEDSVLEMDRKDARKDSEEKEEKKEEKKDSEEAAKAGEKEEKAEEKAGKAIEEAKEEGEKEKEAEKRADAQRRENDALRQQIAEMDKRLSAMSRPLSHEDRDALSRAQARADQVAQMFGDHASPPLSGESPIAYRKRLAAKFQKHSASMKDVRLDSLDGAAFDLMEERIYADAQSVARSPTVAAPGRLMPIRETDSAGRTITKFTGDPMAWMGSFMTPGMVTKINRPRAN